MALEISYWTGVGAQPTPVVGKEISSEPLALTATSAQSGATPANAAILSIVATEAARIAYATNPTAGATGCYVAAGERLWLTATPGFKVAGRTA